jgi:hypothetical protein
MKRHLNRGVLRLRVVGDPGRPGAPRFAVGAVDVQGVVVAGLEHDEVYDRKHHGVVFAAVMVIADGQDGRLH